MKTYQNGTYIGERALFNTENALIINSIFKDGESPLKESKNLKVINTTFKWKYPLWYCNDVQCDSCKILDTARSGIWYTKNIIMSNCDISSPKTFRRSEKITLINCDIPNAQETLWSCKDIKLRNINAKGDYFGMNSSNIDIDHFTLLGNYCFDGGSNIVIRNSRLESKDSFWNSENIEIYDSVIIGEYFGWNSKNITLVNCTVESHQGFCYIKGLKMVNCKLINTDLCFEFCSDLDIELTEPVDSIKNPTSGVIKAPKIKELILEDKYVDKDKIKILVNKDE